MHRLMSRDGGIQPWSNLMMNRTALLLSVNFLAATSLVLARCQYGVPMAEIAAFMERDTDRDGDVDVATA